MSVLSDVELKVLRGTANGETYAETASRIFITEKSVSNVATRVMRKLDAKSMPHAVHLAYQAGLFRRERHGDHAGFAAHRYRDEEPCEACWAGERAYRAEQRQKRRQEAVSGPQGAQEAARGARDGRGAATAPEASRRRAA
ncbi:helix-turn-helix transcriptional regulator [Streptomyces sp. NPDC051362]|uniref:helix-turn-helix transcriptional regulator n=1 Tax=Streptomyces sp. NPDC051362 TaxID=3365651 RepID=UPI0037A4E17C